MNTVAYQFWKLAMMTAFLFGAAALLGPALAEQHHIEILESRYFLDHVADFLRTYKSELDHDDIARIAYLALGSLFSLMYVVFVVWFCVDLTKLIARLINGKDRRRLPIFTLDRTYWLR